MCVIYLCNARCAARRCSWRFAIVLKEERRKKLRLIKILHLYTRLVPRIISYKHTPVHCNIIQMDVMYACTDRARDFLMVPTTCSIGTAINFYWQKLRSTRIDSAWTLFSFKNTYTHIKPYNVRTRICNYNNVKTVDAIGSRFHIRIVMCPIHIRVWI